MRPRILTALAGLPLVAALALTGCASGGEGPGIASAGGAEPDAAASGEPFSDEESMLRYVECLRENGLDVQDPEPGGGLQIRVEKEDAEVAEEAMEACEGFAPSIPEEDAEAMHEEMLGYAQCMRDNGVEAFEDPRPGEGLHIDPDITEDPDFGQAQDACDELLGNEREREENGG